MDLSGESTLLSENSKSPSILPNPTTKDGHAASHLSTKRGAESILQKSHVDAAAGEQRSGAAKFNIRSANTRSQNFSTENKPKKKDLKELRSIFESQAAGAPAEDSTGSRADRQEKMPGAPAHKVSIAIDKPATLNTTKMESCTNQPKSLNQAKTTVFSKPDAGQVRQTECLSEKKAETMDLKGQDDRLGQGTGARGRAEWKRVNFANRSRSLDWRGGSAVNGRRIGIQGFWENHTGCSPRRAESLERGMDMEGGRSTSTPPKVDNSSNHVSSKIKAYNSPEKEELKNHMGLSFDRTASFGRSSQVALALERASKGQSLPSRIKPRLSQCGEEEEGGVLGLHQNGMRRAVETSVNLSISDRIERLFGSASIKRDANSTELLKAKRNSAPVGDWPHFDLQGIEVSKSQKTSSNNIASEPESPSQWKGVSYSREQGGTFPRKSLKGERNVEQQCSRSNGNDANNLSSLKWSASNKGVSGRLLQSHTNPLTKTEDIGGLQQKSVVDMTIRSSDTGKNSHPFSVQSSSLRFTSNEEMTKGKARDPDSNMYDGIWSKRKEGYRQTEEKLGKDDEREDISQENREPKQLKAIFIHQRNPTEKLCEGLDKPVEPLPKKTLASTSTEASIASVGVNKESKQEIIDHAGGKSDFSVAFQPISESAEPRKTGGEKEKGKWEEEEEDVFRINTFPSGQGKKPDGVVWNMSSSSDNVRSKIHRFESLCQQSQSTASLHPLRCRRAFSVPEHPKEMEHLKKSDSDRTLGGVRGKGPTSIGNIVKEPSSKTEGRGDTMEGWKTGWAIRSVSVNEVEKRREGRGMEISGGSVTFTQQPKHYPYKESSYNSTINIEPQGKSFIDEPDSSKDHRPEAKCTSAGQGGISIPLTAKDLFSTQQTNRNSDDLSNVSSTTSTNDVNPNDSINKSEICDANLTTINSFSGSPFISSNQTYSSSGSTYAGQPPNREPEASKSTPHATDSAPLPAANPPLFKSTPYVSTMPAMESKPNQPLPPLITRSFPTDPNFCNEAALSSEAKDPSFLSVCKARWTPEEEQWEDDDEDDDDYDDDDDDDDNDTMKGSNYDSDSAESSVTITSNMSQSDHRSFSVSLADLCNFGGVDYMGRNDGFQDMDSEDCRSQRTASLSSDISAFSCVSILPTEELDRLLEDVRGLGDESLKNYEDVQVVVLHKEVGCGLGFTVAGGMDQNKPVTVHKVFPCGLAAREGSIREGDQVLSINGTALKNSAHWEALRTLRRARTRGMAVVVLQKGVNAEAKEGGADHMPGARDLYNMKKGRTLRVQLKKSSTDLGFSLEGGLGSSQGDGPLTVKKVFQGGPMDDVFPGDELLEINGQSLQGLRRFEAWNLIKKLPPGPVEVVLRRPSKL